MAATHSQGRSPPPPNSPSPPALSDRIRNLPSTCNYGSAFYWCRIYLYSPTILDFEWYCNYDTLKMILADHCYLPANNKAETAFDEDNNGDYDDKKGRDGEKSSAGGGGLPGWGI